jgi:MFS family permease
MGLMNTPMLGAMIAAFIVEFCFGVWSPLIAPFIQDQFGGGAVYSGLVMAIPAVSYGLCGTVLPTVLKMVSRPKLIFTGLFILGLGLAVMDPCSIFPSLCVNYRLRVVILVVVQLLMGGASTFAFVPTLGLMLNSVRHVPGDTHGSISGAWNSMVALGQVLGPILAEEFSKYAQFPTIMMTLGATTMTVGFVVFFLTASSSKHAPQSPKPEERASDYGTLILNA